MNELEEAAKLMKTDESKEILEFSNIINAISNDNVKIPLIDFENYLLPYILGETKKTDANSAVYIANYLAITKSHSVGITVLDKDGEVMFKLPPLISDTDISKLDNIAFGKIVAKVNTYSKASPRKANMLLNKTIEEVKDKIDTGKDDNEHIKELIKIYDYYKDRVNAVMGKEAAKVSILEEEEEDLFDY